MFKRLAKHDPRLAIAAEVAIEECARIHQCDRGTAAALLIRSGQRRLRAARKYAASEKGEISNARYESRRSRGLVRGRRRRTKRARPAA